LKLVEFLKEGALVFRDTELWRIKSTTTTKESLLMSLSSSDLQICNLIRSLEARSSKAKIPRRVLAREGCNSARAANYRTQQKEIDLSDLACSCWEFRRAYISLLLLYLGAIISHTHYSSISILDLSISCTEVMYIFK